MKRLDLLADLYGKQNSRLTNLYIISYTLTSQWTPVQGLVDQ